MPDHATSETMRMALLLSLLILAAPAEAETILGDRLIVLDGDTVALPCATPFPGCAEKVRLLDIDTPESFRPHCEAELRAGLKAKARLVEIVRGEEVEVERSGKLDRYRRTLGRLHVTGIDVGETLLAEGLALPYVPGAAAKAERIRHWCPRVG
jgi:micrococcal nuclease